MMNGCHCILEPLGVKKTQETCSVVTKSLILRPRMTLFLALGARFRCPKVGREPWLFLGGGGDNNLPVNICGLFFVVQVSVPLCFHDMTSGSSQLQGVKMSEALVIHIKLN